MELFAAGQDYPALCAVLSLQICLCLPTFAGSQSAGILFPVIRILNPCHQEPACQQEGDRQPKQTGRQGSLAGVLAAISVPLQAAGAIQADGIKFNNSLLFPFGKIS